MPVVLALLLAAKAAHAQRQIEEEASHSQSSHSRKTMKAAQLEQRGAYMLDVANGRICLPPEGRETSNGETATKDNEALSSEELTSTMMGLPNNDILPHANAMGTKQPTTFRNDVRNEWIDAMFGRNFLLEGDDTWRDLSVRQGIGEAGVGSWVAYGALLDPHCDDTNGATNGRDCNDAKTTTPKSTPKKDSALSTLLKTKSTPLMTAHSISSNVSFAESLLTTQQTDTHHFNNSNSHSKAKKIGVTISRIPLGVYVQSIDIESEAYTMGISPGSILLDINGLGLLGETSHRAVERLWRYSGSSSRSTSANDADSLKVSSPVTLRFYKNARVYSVFLMSAHPLAGITWAPCGNFGLVQRSIGLASKCGVRRGCLVLAVNGVALRSLDHVGVARALMEGYDQGRKSVVLTCGYTPATSRSGYYEENKTVEKKNGSASSVEVRPRPVEYSTALSETFFACTAPSMALVDEGGVLEGQPRILGVRGKSDNNVNVGATELAAYVAAGGVLPSNSGIVTSELDLSESSQQQRRRIAGNWSCGPCPTIESERLLDAWDPLVSLTRSMSYQALGCCETSYAEMGGAFRVTWGNGNYSEEAAHSTEDCIRAISEIGQHPTAGVAEQVFDGHLMQLLSVACCALYEKDDESNTNNYGKKLLDIVLDVALNDINLCQRLFFLVRCFLGVLDGQATDDNAKSLKLLRYLQRRLSSRMFDKSASLDANPQCSKGYPMSREVSSTSSFGRKISQLDIALSRSSEKCDTHTPGAPANRQQEGASPSQDAISATSSLRIENSTSGDCLSVDNVSCQTPASTMSATSKDSKKRSKIKSGSSMIRQLLKGGKSKSSIKTVADSSQLPPSAGITRTLKQGTAFTFNVFHKSASPSISTQVPITMSLSMSHMFDNLAWILRRIDSMCSEIEKTLVKSFPQKMADLALRPWNASKESALAAIIQSFRAELRRMNSDSNSHFPILNPIDSSEQFTAVDADECLILPSAHFPMLLCFNSSMPTVSKKEGSYNTLYRTKVEILGLDSTISLGQKTNDGGEVYIVRGAVGGLVQESGASELLVNPTRSSHREVTSHRWTKGNTLSFEFSSNSGHPKTLSLTLSAVSRDMDARDDTYNVGEDDMGCAFFDLTPVWNQIHKTSNQTSITSNAQVFLFEDQNELFDQHGVAESRSNDKEVELQIKVSLEIVPAVMYPQKRLLLYKHGDDMRQELLAIQFVERCNQILQASGLDLKLRTFRCLPVGEKRGFIEWVNGTVPLSEICRSTCSPGSNVGSRQSSCSKESLDNSRHSSPAEGDSTELSNAPARKSWCKYQSIRGLGASSNGMNHNPIQDFLRSAAYDENAPYYIKKDVMDSYIKSCAGYCVITYLLGVGDRHLDNILLHQNGHLLHCDFSFILGRDPKTYLPMRITEEMIRGFGGRESDNFAKFLSFTGAAFLTLRRHNNMHSLLSQIRNMLHSNETKELSLAQPPADAIMAMRKRFKLELNDDDALTYIEHVVEKSITSRIWRAVDVMHSLGKHF